MVRTAQARESVHFAFIMIRNVTVAALGAASFQKEGNGNEEGDSGRSLAGPRREHENSEQVMARDANLSWAKPRRA
jgi:hypothetical protein